MSSNNVFRYDPPVAVAVAPLHGPLVQMAYEVEEQRMWAIAIERCHARATVLQGECHDVN